MPDIKDRSEQKSGPHNGRRVSMKQMDGQWSRVQEAMFRASVCGVFTANDFSREMVSLSGLSHSLDERLVGAILFGRCDVMKIGDVTYEHSLNMEDKNMATNGSDLPPCDPEILKKGVGIGVFETFGANHFEGLVKAVAHASGRTVDWHYVGGRAFVRCFPEDELHVRPFVEKIITPVITSLREDSLRKYSS